MFALDTNILIYYSFADKKVVSFLESNREAIFYLPSIVAVEFLSYPLIDQETITKFRLFVSQTVVINLDLRIAELSAELRRIYKIKLADAVIAATAISTNSYLVTRDIKDFKKIKGLKLLPI
ncbi:type II toxin-antitoxin system VapC family toxin [Patescibacteria group bacterium]|nr:type II toxin-antitoxin system VapC family toxin [Patescibacteria group bacterium]MBU4480974.1 type II toxin-antitoxin system VapC family toxin [Patescibacteria group bacterium]